MNIVAPPAQKVAPTSAPALHEVATFLPGRLEFEHELDNEAEDLVKDLEFGICLEWGGNQIVEDDQDTDVRARAKIAEEKRSGIVVTGVSKSLPPGKGPPAPKSNGLINGYHPNGDVKARPKSEDVTMTNGTAGEEEEAEEPTLPPPYETKDSLTFKLTLLEMYSQHVEKRHEAKAVMFERGLLEYKKVHFPKQTTRYIWLMPSQVQAADKKRPREEREILHRLRPFARLQTADDYEAFAADMLCMSSFS
jgi:transcriptional adapter 2-alpha